MAKLRLSKYYCKVDFKRGEAGKENTSIPSSIKSAA
jgi:hypothetical protein